MARVDAVVQQRQGDPVNLKRGSIATMFRQKYDAVSTARAKRRAEADLEAADVATYDQSFDAAPDPAACEQRQEMAEADAYIAGEEALADELNQMFKENQAAEEAEEATISSWCCVYYLDNDYDGGYNSDSDQCGCHSAFGKDDDGEVLHNGLNCQYHF